MSKDTKLKLPLELAKEIAEMCKDLPTRTETIDGNFLHRDHIIAALKRVGAEEFLEKIAYHGNEVKSDCCKAPVILLDNGERCCKCRKDLNVVIPAYSRPS